MNIANPLDQLKDIHLPESASFWPLAPGWWFLIVISSLLLCVLSYQYYKNRTYRSAKKQALAELDRDYQNLTEFDYSLAVNRLLKRTAISFGYTECKPFFAEDWELFLDSHTSESNYFSINIPEFKHITYKPNIDIDKERLHKCAKTWIKGLKHV